MVSSDAGIDDALHWAHVRDASLAHLGEDALREAVTNECELWGVDPDPVVAAALDAVHTRSLIPAEIRRLVGYRELCRKRLQGDGSNPDGDEATELLVCYVGQGPGHHAQGSTGTTMTAVIKSGSVLWADGSVKRAFAGTEFLACQGFVACDAFSGGFLSSSSM